MAAIQQHLLRGPLDDGLIFDAVRVRLIAIGEAIEDLDASLVAQPPQIPWRQVVPQRGPARPVVAACAQLPSYLFAQA